MTEPEKEWYEFFDEGIVEEYGEDKIICPFCHKEYYDDLCDLMYEEEFTCGVCGSIMTLRIREILECKTQPLFPW